MLYKFGGSGFTKVINSYLQSHGGCLHGLHLAFKRPDKTTIELLRNIAMRDEPSGHRPSEQVLAIHILVYLGHWCEVVVALSRWGLKVVDRDLPFACANREPVGDTALAPALEALNRQEVVDTGDVLAVGLGGRVDQLERIRSILQGAAPKSDLAKACVISLAILRDSSPEAVTLLIDQLDVSEHRYWSQVGLLHSECDLALEALLIRLHVNFDLSLAIDLLHRPYARDRAQKMLVLHLRDAPDSQLEDLLPHILMLEDEFLMPILEDGRIRDLLRDESYADVGSSRIGVSMDIAILGLSKFDVDAAFIAGRKALRNPGSRDRARYPDLLVQIDADRATGELLECILVEKDVVVLQAMGRALRAGDLSDTLFDWAKSSEINRRIAACRWAATTTWSSDAVVATLRSMTDDRDEHVAQSAWDSLRKQRGARAAESLLTAALAEKERSLRWIFVDALLQIGDPEDDHRPLPEWAVRVARDTPYFEQKYIRDRLEERRRSLTRSEELF